MDFLGPVSLRWRGYLFLLSLIRQEVYMLASIVIPAFRETENVGAAVRSALGQSWKDLEVIVVDDGSKDGTAEAAEKSAGGDERFRVLRLEQNRGLSGARNAGFEIARGDWLAILDADDTFETDRLSTLLPQAVSSGADIFADNICVKWLSGKYPDHLAFPRARMERRGPVSAVSFIASDRPRWGLRSSGYIKPIIRRGFLLDHDLRYQEDVRLCEDFHFYIQCLLNGAVLGYSEYAGYHYSIRGGSLSSSQPNESLLAQIASNRRLTEEAVRRNALAPAAELKRRERDIELWSECIAIREELRVYRFVGAANKFRKSQSKTYVVCRFAEKIAKELAKRSGRDVY